jgi:hypothetical protein
MKPGPRPLADLLDGCLAPALAAQGFATTDILVSWPDIVGERLAAHCEPVKLQWPRRRAGADEEAREPATLVIRVEGAFALELQHVAPLVVERVNGFYGWRCVGRVTLRQGPVQRREPAARRRPDPDATSVQDATRVVGAVQDEGLRDALTRLGASILAARAGS